MSKILRAITYLTFAMTSGSSCFGQLATPQANIAINDKLNRLFTGTSTTTQLLYALPNLITAKIFEGKTTNGAPRFIISFSKLDRADDAINALKETVAAQVTRADKKKTAGFDEAFFWTNVRFVGRKDRYVVGLGIAVGAPEKGTSLSSLLTPFLKNFETNPNFMDEIFQLQARVDQPKK